MTGPSRSDLLRMLMGIIAGGLVLFAFNLYFNPVPIAAAPAFALGVLGFLRLGPGTWPWVGNLAAVGALVGIFIHRGWHIEGSSPPPAEGLFSHLATEGLIGLAAALISLGVVAAVLKLLESR